jgi:hypothetical protein
MSLAYQGNEIGNRKEIFAFGRFSEGQMFVRSAYYGAIDMQRAQHRQ